MQIANPDDQETIKRYAATGQLDNGNDFVEKLKMKATYVDPEEKRLARPRRRRGAILFSQPRMESLMKGLTEVKGGALVQMCSLHGTNPLFRAIAKNDLQLVALVAKQCSRIALNTESHNGDTPLSLACRLGSRKCAELLIDSGADVNLETSRGV